MVEQSVGEMLRDSYTAEARSNFDNIRRLGQDRYDSILYGAYNFAEKENPDTSPDGFSHNPSFNYDMVEGDMQNAINTLTVMGLPHLVFDLKRKYLHVLVWHIKAQRREEKTEGRTESVSGPSEYKPETDMPPWVQERLNEAMQQLGLSDDSKLKAVLTVLTELGWKGTEAEEQVVSQIRDLAQQLNIPIMADTVVGFCELLLGLFDTRHGPTVEERFNILKPHLGDWIKHNLLATADLLPLLKGAKVAAVAATLLKTLGNNGEESTGGATIQWNVLTREAIKLVLDQMAERTSSDTSGGKLAQAVVGVLSELLEKDVSVFDATVRELSADQSVQQGLRNLAAGLQEPSEGGTDSAEGN